MKAIYLIFIFQLTSSILFAQTMVSGVVKDGKETIIGANVFLKDTYDGASTDIDGRFSFETTEQGTQVLSISYIGYELFELEIDLNQAQDALVIELKPEANELDAVVITAGAFEASDEKKAVVLNSIDIVTTAGATGDTYGALNTLPGTQKVGESGQLFVRGGAASETRTFIDGMLVHKPYNSTVPDLPARGRFSPFLFKGTMFSTGGYSAEYGQAMSSALILNTQDLPEEDMTSISLMSVGLGLARTKRWDKTSLSVSGGYTNLAPYTSLVKQNMDWIKPFQGADAQVIFRHKTSETGMFKFYTSGSSNWFAMNRLNDVDLKEMNRLDLNNNNLYVNTSFREILNDKWSLFTGLAFTYDKNSITEQFNLQSYERSGQAKITLSNQVNDHLKIKFGGEHFFSNWDEQFTDTNEEVFHTNITENLSSAFLESDIYLSNRLVARLGGRLEYSQVLRSWNVAPRTSLAYKTGAKSQISLAYGQFFQTPEGENFRYSTQFDFERADHFMANYQVMKDQRIFRVEAYQKNYKSLVRYQRNTPWIIENSGDGYARGLDVFFRDRKSLKKGDYWISYSYLDTERFYKDYPEASTPNFASKHNLSLVYKHWFHKASTSVGVTYAFSSPRPFHNPNESAFNTGRTKPFHDLSINASKLMNIKGNFTILHVSVTNVFGIENSFGNRYATTPDANGKYASQTIEPGAKRFFFVGLFVSIGEKFDKETAEKPD